MNKPDITTPDVIAKRIKLAQYIHDEYRGKGKTVVDVTFPDEVLTACIVYSDGTTEKVTGGFAVDLKWLQVDIL